MHITDRISNIIFYTGFSFLLTHELDAMIRSEWRLIPFMKTIPDETGMNIFILVHIPIFAAGIALISSTNIRTRSISRIGFAMFFIFHGILHTLLKAVEIPEYDFNSLLSKLIIYSCSVFGIVYIFISKIRRV